MQVEQINKPLFTLPDEHPARRFLDAFLDCRALCVGQELPPPHGQGIDQQWISTIDGKKLSFSGFAYSYLSFDVELDGWLTAAPTRTESEIQVLRGLPRIRTLMNECRNAAKKDHNRAIVELVNRVSEVLNLWEACIEARTPQV